MAIPDNSKDRFGGQYADGRRVGEPSWPMTRALSADALISDSVDLAFVSRAVWVGSAGDLSVVMADDAGSRVIPLVPDGTWLPIRIKRITSIGTTASNIVVFD